MTIAKMAFHLLICFVCAMELIIVLLVGVFSCNAYCPGTTIKQEVKLKAPTLQIKLIISSRK